MMETHDLISLEIRRKIFHFITKYPGLHLREISRKLSIPKTTLNYHLRYLEKEGFIIGKHERRYLRYYAAKTVGNFEKGILSVIREETPRRIILFLFLYPEHSRIDMSKEIGKAPTTLSFYLKELVDKDIIERSRVGHTYAYRIKNQKEMYRVLIMYENSLSYDIVEYLLNWVKFVIPGGVPTSYRKRKKADIDEMYEALLEIFPHPYHV